MNWFLRLNPHCDLNSYSASVEATVVVPHSTFMDTIIVALCYHISHTIAATATLQYCTSLEFWGYATAFTFLSMIKEGEGMNVKKHPIVLSHSIVLLLKPSSNLWASEGLQTELD